MDKPKYETGSYHVLFFGKHGTPTDRVTVDTYQEAHSVGRSKTKSPPHASYVVLRVMFNSMDTYYPWETEEDYDEHKT